VETDESQFWSAELLARPPARDMQETPAFFTTTPDVIFTHATPARPNSCHAWYAPKDQSVSFCCRVNVFTNEDVTARSEIDVLYQVEGLAVRAQHPC